MNIPKPKADLFAVVGGRETEQAFQAARPGERSGCYIPIPNRIIRSPGNEFKIIRIRCRNDFERGRFLFLRTVFMRFSEQFCYGIKGCCCHCGHGRGRPAEKARSVPTLAATRLNSLAFARHRKYGCARTDVRRSQPPAAKPKSSCYRQADPGLATAAGSPWTPRQRQS